MFKKYTKLSLLFCIPVFIYVLYVITDIQSGHYSIARTNFEAGGIEYPAIPFFSSYFSSAILVLSAVALLLNLFIFTELRSRNVGGFITSLPVMKSRIYTSVFWAGFMLITLSYLPMAVYFLIRLNNVLNEVLQVFSMHGRYDEGLQKISEAIQTNRVKLFGNYCLTISLYALLCFVQTLFQRPIAAVCALVGALGGAILCTMTIDKYLFVITGAGIAQPLYQLRYYIRYAFFGSSETALVDLGALIAITSLLWVCGLWLFKKDGCKSDSLFTFPAVKLAMHTGVTLCSGSLMVYILFTIVGMEGLTITLMNIFFLFGMVTGFITTNKIYGMICWK